MSCKHFSLQRALHAGDPQEESLGPARDAPLHRVLIHLGSRGVDSGFHLHSVLGVACEALLQHFVDLVLPSRPDVVVERFEVWRICKESRREQCHSGGPDEIALSPSGCSNEPRALGILALPFSVEDTKCGSQTPPSNVAPAATMMPFMNFATLESHHVWLQVSLSADFSHALCRPVQAKPALYMPLSWPKGTE